MHIITTLGPAGAEIMLTRVASGMDATRFENEVVSLTAILDLAERVRGMGVRVRTLGMKTGVPNPLLVMRLAQWIRESKPDVIHTWMYHANLVGALAARLAGDVPVVWHVSQSGLCPLIKKIPGSNNMLLRGVAAHPRESWLLRQENGGHPQRFRSRKNQTRPFRPSVGA